ncbi:uncharacterized protein NCU02410 [Neurospora crassa OR74A]|uniref:HAUS augmin-like complex subunit 1 n=1 Tax=Neurospora crassa (strain ATCC 24698 / 74-OR23-1A / CBS 708.71 / DSM 1257 / FGSC 987) TaxID=367110 RepID=V5IKE5_NEUCR|nr:hypothetical protein NCU02410 [Neurospora crassa OR74A]XP_011395171.1 uncharacterized protein NCU02410 [Neurospora crassa OR74A]ESA41958.1 hypothetical protein NCU02410 [Neurospora crassa OR74A]ESA41959.1 hypothetical protein, variant [Neurospora crassa OR74A]|eukprot:XP_011395170.1 hypothetical protein NCU02410 [Neurospora crassa OR74A]
MSSHLPPSAPVIFSPSVARAAASAAKDWSYVDSWLHAKYTPLHLKVPSFERNPETLKALLALATANEAADDPRQQIADLESATQVKLNTSNATSLGRTAAQAQGDITPSFPSPSASLTYQEAKQSIFSLLSASLTPAGQESLTSLSYLSQTLSLPVTQGDPIHLASSFLSLSAELNNLEQARQRLDLLSSHITCATASIEKLLVRLRRHLGCSPAAGLAKENLEVQRRIRMLAGQTLPQLKEKMANLADAVVGGHGGGGGGGEEEGRGMVTVEQVRREQEAYLELLRRKHELDVKVRAFQGLPPDIEQARRAVELLREGLRSLTSRRDEEFEGLVEGGLSPHRETGTKGMTGNSRQ